jgi:hypothetical protein
MKKTTLLISILLFLTFNLLAQTPPERTWFYNQQGQKTTVKERWFEDDNGFKHGKYIHYDYDWSNEYFVSEIGNYNHGKKEGEWKTFSSSSNTTITNIGSYKNNLQAGYWKENYDITNKIYQEGEYINGLRNGKWINTNPKKSMGLVIPLTTTGYYTIYDMGEIKSIYNEKGENILLKEQLEKEQQEKQQLEYQQQSKLMQQQEDDFNNAMNKYEDNTTYYGDTTALSNFIKKYPNTDYADRAKQEIQNKADNDAYYFANKDLAKYVKYQKNFPNGIHITEVNKFIKSEVLNNTQTFITGINQKLEEGNTTKAIELCELVLKYKSDLHNSQYLPITIYYSLALWSSGNTTKAIDVIKPYVSTLINYSDGDKKFMDKYFTIYDQYKKPLHIDSDKETYKKIKTL